MKYMRLLGRKGLVALLAGVTVVMSSASAVQVKATENVEDANIVNEQVELVEIANEETALQADLVAQQNFLKKLEQQLQKDQIALAHTTRFDSVKTVHSKSMGYWVYRPTESKEKKLPLIVYLHGKDGCGNNPSRLLQIEGIPQYIEKGKIYPNAIVVAPQCPSGSSWTNYSSDVMTMIAKVIEDENVDVNKIALTGASLGGIGTFNIAINNPDFFSCIVPVCGSVNAQRCKVLSSVPTRIFHGTKDYGMGFSVKDADKVINANGGNSELTWIQGEGHEIRHIYTDEEYDIINWMISQEKNVVVEDEKVALDDTVTETTAQTN